METKDFNKMRFEANNLLIVHPHLSFFGGAEILLCNMTKHLVDFGMKVTIITLSLDQKVKNQFHTDIRFITPPKKNMCIKYGVPVF